MLIVAPILIHCDLEKLFILDIGAILSQKPSHMKKHVVDFARVCPKACVTITP
jgi:hypothetical protein